jgi:hypothetical protein
LTLPYYNNVSSVSDAIQIQQLLATSGGIAGIGGPSGGSLGSGGFGLSGLGGAAGAAGQFGGFGVAGEGGDAGASSAYGGDGGYFRGGGSDSAAVYGGAGIYGQGGDAVAPGLAGSGIESWPGTGPSDNLTYGLAGYFAGSVNVNGNLSKAGGSFVIDHPIDPEHKYLYHSFVESPDMKNIYDGNVVTDSSGAAVVKMPDWFEALNRDFRYQLTAIGQPAQAWVAAKIANGQFVIKTDRPGVEVSWQVTGIRQDAWANAHRIPLEVEKAEADQGHYLHPELFGRGREPDIHELHHPRPAKKQPENNGR